MKRKDNVTWIGTLDGKKAYETIGNIIGDRMNMEVKLSSLEETPKEETSKKETSKEESP